MKQIDDIIQILMKHNEEAILRHSELKERLSVVETKIATIEEEIKNFPCEKMQHRVTKLEHNMAYSKGKIAGLIIFVSGVVTGIIEFLKALMKK